MTIKTETTSTTEITKTYVHKNAKMTVTIQDGDIVKLMFHRQYTEYETGCTNWKHLFSLKKHQLFSYREVKELLYSFIQLFLIARNLLIDLGG